MSSSNITARDRVWAAIFVQQGQFRVTDIREAIGGERPSDETIRRVLRSATELGIIEHQPGSPYYSDASHSLPGYLDPEGIDTEAILDLVPDERTEDVIFKESDEEIAIEDIISDERAAQLAQSGQPEGHYIPVVSSRGRQPNYPKIEEHVRRRVQTFEAEAGTLEWDTQVEDLVGEIVEEVEPNDLHEQSVISEWIRSMTKNEMQD